MKECQYCGPNPINHQSARWAIIFDLLFKPLFVPIELLRHKIGNLVKINSLKNEKYIAKTLRFLSKIGIGRIESALDSEDSYRTKCLWDSAQKRGISIERYRLGDLSGLRTLMIAEYNEDIAVFDGLPRPSRKYPKSIEWVDDKAIMRDKFKKASIPVAKGGVCLTLAQAKSVFRDIASQVIVKPRTGSRSRHTTIHINSEDELEEAFYVAKQLSPWVVVEEELSGMVFRATVIAGKTAGVIRREPPHVIGDGEHTVSQLVDIANQHPERQGPLFHHINLGIEAQNELLRQNFTGDSVPENGEVVLLGQKIGRGSGGSTTELTNKAHPQNIQLFEKIADFLGDSLVGIDFIVEDIEKPWPEQAKCGVIECNSLPFIDLHHYPLFGEPRDVAGALWESVFSSSRNPSK